MTARQKWAHIIAGEAGYGYEDGQRLVAWTIRAWEIYRGFRASQFGPRIGWYGWAEPDKLAWSMVEEVWGQDPRTAPYDFMQSGKFCRALGNNADARLWLSNGWYPNGPDYRLSLLYPGWGEYGINCYWNAPS